MMPDSRYIFASLPWYSVLIVTGFCAAIFWGAKEEKRLRLPKDTVVDLALWVIPLGIVGARLYYVFFAWDTFAENPLSILYIWRGGLAIYGGIIGGFLAAFLFSRHRHISLCTILDMLTPGVLLAQAIGRWGNFFNMEAYGLPITNQALQFFPLGVQIPENGVLVWHMATFFYESAWDLAGFVILALSRKKMRRPGDITAWYFLLYGSGRLIIEGLRLDSLMTTGGSARISQLLSVLLCMAVYGYFAVRALPKITGLQVLSGLFSAGATLCAALLLPRPQAAFLGYEIIYFLSVCGIMAVSVMLALSPGHTLRARFMSLLPALAAVFTLACRRYLTLYAPAEWVNALVLCALFSFLLLCGAACVYPAANAQETHPHLSTL